MVAGRNVYESLYVCAYVYAHVYVYIYAYPYVCNLSPRLKKNYSFTTTPSLGLPGLL